MGSQLQVQGSVSSSPSSPSAANGLTVTVGLGDTRVYPNFASASIPVAGTDLSPKVLDSGVAKVRFMSLRSLGRDRLVALLTSAAGIDQRVGFDELLVLHAAADGQEYTAIKFIGNGTVEFVVAGE